MAWNPITRVGDAIMALVSTIWDGGKSILKTTWDFMLRGWGWWVGLFWVFVSATVTLISSVKAGIDILIVKLGEIVLPVSNVVQSVGDWLSIANTFAPITEGFVVLVGLSTLWLTMLLYRFIKSWIPTVA